MQQTGEVRVWEECIVLLQCEAPAEARQRAEQLARKAEHSYRVQDGAVLEWRFVGIPEVHQLGEELIDGEEMLSRFLSNSTALALLNHQVDD